MIIKGIRKFHQLFTIIITLLFTMSFFLMTDSAYGKRERRGDDSHREREYKERRERDSDRYSRQNGRRDGDYSRSYRDRNKRRVVSSPVRRHGHSVRKLPRGYSRVWYKNKPYYYSQGVFYVPDLSGFVVVRAPIGSIVVSLPVGYRRIWTSGGWYFSYGGTFYRRAASGYVVVQAPAEVIVEEEPPDIIKPSESAFGQVSVTASILNVRSGPDLDYPLIYQVHKGYILDVHGKSGAWLYVELPNGEFGWVMDQFTYHLKAPGSG